MTTYDKIQTRNRNEIAVLNPYDADENVIHRVPTFKNGKVYVRINRQKHEVVSVEFEKGAVVIYGVEFNNGRK